MSNLNRDDRKINDACLALEAAGATITRRGGVLVVVLLAESAADRMSVAEAAAYAKCSERRVREAARKGELPATELGERAISFTRADVDMWLAKHPIRVRVAESDDDAALERLLSEAGE